MRVIAGSARGRPLLSVPGDATRPITDRAKEALFDILSATVAGRTCLDLFAGTGGVGIEALSRGARRCDFVELAPAAVRTIQANLERTGLADRARVLRRDVFALLRLSPIDAYDLVYVAPPQYRGWWRDTLLLLDASPGWLSPDGIVVVQVHPREIAEIDLHHLVSFDRRRYGSVLLVFFERASEADR